VHNLRRKIAGCNGSSAAIPKPAPRPFLLL